MEGSQQAHADCTMAVSRGLVDKTKQKMDRIEKRHSFAQLFLLAFVDKEVCDRGHYLFHLHIIGYCLLVSTILITASKRQYLLIVFVF